MDRLPTDLVYDDIEYISSPTNDRFAQLSNIGTYVYPLTGTTTGTTSQGSTYLTAAQVEELTSRYLTAAQVEELTRASRGSPYVYYGNPPIGSRGVEYWSQPFSPSGIDTQTFDRIQSIPRSRLDWEKQNDAAISEALLRQKVEFYEGYKEKSPYLNSPLNPPPRPVAPPLVKTKSEPAQMELF